MEFEEVPVGFGTALTRNEDALNAFAMMTKDQKQAIWAKARHAGSKAEMEQIVSEIISK